MKSISHVKTVRACIQRDKARVMQLLGWNDLQYAQYVEQMGYEYLKQTYGNTPFIDQLPYTKEYWAWFRNQWAKREEIFLMAADTMQNDQLLDQYEAIHDPRRFEFHPHSKILEYSYAQMVGKVIKEVVK